MRLVLLVGPLVVASAVVSVIAIGEGAGLAPFSAGRPRNSAEAAAAGDVVTLMRHLREGADPLRIEPIPPEVISSSVRQASAVEAAILARRGAVVTILTQRVPLLDASARRELACLASDVGQADLAATFEPAGPPCVPGEALARVQARTPAAAR